MTNSNLHKMALFTYDQFVKFEFRRGLKRVALALGIPWVVYWGFVGWRGYEVLQDARHLIDQQPPGARIPAPVLEALERSNRHLFDAVVFGAGMPIAICGLTLLGLWIYRGFKPSADRTDS